MTPYAVYVPVTRPVTFRSSFAPFTRVERPSASVGVPEGIVVPGIVGLGSSAYRGDVIVNARDVVNLKGALRVLKM